MINLYLIITGHHGDDADSMSPTIVLDGQDSDSNEEPLLSGFGDVSKECSGSELDSWSQVLQGEIRKALNNLPKIWIKFITR